MVKFRGIDLSWVSQLDIRRLPEFVASSDHDPSESINAPREKSVAACYVPIYPGSQVWLEYSIEGPHPSRAAYLFKLLHNGKLVTSFDCTAKHGYHGKAVYRLEYVGNDDFTGMPLVKRQAFKFSEHNNVLASTDPGNDCIEVRVYRIEHRKRMPVDSFKDDISPLEDPKASGFCLAHCDLLDQCHHLRRYKYQLSDPVGDPYATFRFFYSSYEFLEQQNIIQTPSERSCSVSLLSSSPPTCTREQ